MENILWLVIFRFLQRISRRLCWIGFGGSYELQLHNIVKVHLQQISDINWTSDSSPSPSSFSQSSSRYCQGSSPTNCQNQTHHHHNNCQVLAPQNCHHLLIILTRCYGYLSFLVPLSQSRGVLSDSKSSNWHLIWQNKKSSRGTFGLWGNILSGSLRILPKHFLPKPVSEPLDKKYQVWIWGSAFLLCYSLRDANKKIQMPDIMETDNKYFTRYHLLTSPMAGWASQQDKGCWQSYVWNLPHWYFKSYKSGDWSKRGCCFFCKRKMYPPLLWKKFLTFYIALE